MTLLYWWTNKIQGSIEVIPSQLDLPTDMAMSSMSTCPRTAQSPATNGTNSCHGPNPVPAKIYDLELSFFNKPLARRSLFATLIYAMDWAAYNFDESSTTFHPNARWGIDVKFVKRSTFQPKIDKPLIGILVDYIQLHMFPEYIKECKGTFYVDDVATGDLTITTIPKFASANDTTTNSTSTSMPTSEQDSLGVKGPLNPNIQLNLPDPHSAPILDVPETDLIENIIGAGRTLLSRARPDPFTTHVASTQTELILKNAGRY